jgi:hypothetical protein
VQDDTSAFLAQIQQKVAQARAAATAREEQSARRRRHAQALYERAVSRFQALARAMPEDFVLKEADRGTTLEWKATLPPRRLEVGLSRESGDMLAAYARSEPKEDESPFHRLDPFDATTIDRLIEGLADEEIWLSGRFPALPGEPMTTPGASDTPGNEAGRS